MHIQETNTLFPSHQMMVYLPVCILLVVEAYVLLNPVVPKSG